MCEIYSPSGSEGELCSYLVERMKSLGWIAYVDEAGNAVGETGGSAGAREATLLLLGHMDTVPGFIPVRIADGRLFGRGSVDAKGALATFISAAARARRLRRRVVIVGTVEEETDFSRGAVFVRDRYRPDFCVIGEPSGWSAVTLGYRGRLVAEARLTRSVVHSALASSSALEDGIDLWNRISSSCRRRAENGSPFGTLDVRLKDIRAESDGFEESCRMAMVFRLPLGVDPDHLAGTLSGEFRRAGAEVDFAGGQPAYKGGKSNSLVREFIRAIRQEGGEPVFKLKTGTSDMNVVGPAWSCPILAYGPGDSSLDHTPQEHLLLSEYGMGIRVLARVLESL